MLRAIAIFLAALLLAGCASRGTAPAGGAASARITGTVTHPQGIALPPTAVVKVQLVDVSRADAPAIVVAQQIIQASGKQIPFAFAIPYDPAQIASKHTYAVQAHIEAEGGLRFVSDTRYVVITGGAPTQVDVVLKAVEPAE